MDFRQFANLVLIEQTLFTLPFALIGVLFAGGGTLDTWVWVIVALTAARTAGMSFNRVIDADIDAENPRTKDRLLPQKIITRKAVWLTAGVSSLVLIFAAYMLNTLCFVLSFPAVLLLYTYSYFKRFSASSHFYLGFVEAAAPIGGYLAVTGKFAFIPFVLGFAIMTWIAGLDIVYALQDLSLDTRQRLHSLPVSLGKQNALRISCLSYGMSIIALVYAGVLAQMGGPYFIGLLFIAGIFFMQQKSARSEALETGIRRFFRYNIWIAPILFLGSLVDVFMV